MVEENRIEALHIQLQQWKSHLQFIEDETAFIERLLNSYVFEPRTPNLFERLETFKQRFRESKKERERLKRAIIRHEGILGGIYECTSKICDEGYYQKHCELQERVQQYFEDYLKLKTEVYGYAGSILKRRKPTK
ncbi:MAG: hypothetical protein R2819_14795 [Allomuricauda sp.]